MVELVGLFVSYLGLRQQILQLLDLILLLLEQFFPGPNLSLNPLIYHFVPIFELHKVLHTLRGVNVGLSVHENCFCCPL